MQALEGADALVVVTEWRAYRSPDFAQMKRLMRQPVIIDGRNLWEPALLHSEGFEYRPIGRGAVGCAVTSAAVEWPLAA